MLVISTSSLMTSSSLSLSPYRRGNMHPRVAELLDCLPCAPRAAAHRMPSCGPKWHQNVLPCCGEANFINATLTFPFLQCHWHCNLVPVRSGHAFLPSAMVSEDSSSVLSSVFFRTVNWYEPYHIDTTCVPVWRGVSHSTAQSYKKQQSLSRSAMQTVNSVPATAIASPYGPQPVSSKRLDIRELWNALYIKCVRVEIGNACQSVHLHHRDWTEQLLWMTVSDNWCSANCG